MLKLSRLVQLEIDWFQNNANILHPSARVPSCRFSIGNCVPASPRINNSRQFRVTARRNEDRRIPVVFDRNLLAARGRAQRMIHRSALSLFGKYFRGWARAVMPPLVALVRVSNGLKRTSEETRRSRGGPLMFRYVCPSCSSFRGWYAARWLCGRKVFRTSTKGGGGPDGAGGGLWFTEAIALYFSPGGPPVRPTSIDIAL